MNKKWKQGNKNKAEFLGMPWGTAAGRLRKMIMFDLLKQFNRNFCYKCGKLIKDIDDLSIEHKKPWLYVDKNLFWDLSNIAFSHLKCNTTDRPRGFDEDCKEGFYWCSCCKKCLSIKYFGKCNASKSGLKPYCKNCRKTAGWGHPERINSGERSK